MTVPVLPPALFLDVDGTIAPLGDDVSWATTFLYPHRAASTLSVPFRADVVDRIAGLHASGVVEVQWLTTWEPRQTIAWTQVGLGPFLTADRSPVPAVRGSARRTWWKAGVVEGWLVANPARRAVWADDDLRRRKPRGLRGRDRLLMVGPVRTVGLTHEDLDRVEAWVTQSHRVVASYETATDL